MCLPAIEYHLVALFYFRVYKVPPVMKSRVVGWGHFRGSAVVVDDGAVAAYIFGGRHAPDRVYIAEHCWDGNCL